MIALVVDTERKPSNRAFPVVLWQHVVISVVLRYHVVIYVVFMILHVVFAGPPSHNKLLRVG